MLQFCWNFDAGTLVRCLHSFGTVMLLLFLNASFLSVIKNHEKLVFDKCETTGRICQFSSWVFTQVSHKEIGLFHGERESPSLNKVEITVDQSGSWLFHPALLDLLNICSQPLLNGGLVFSLWIKDSNRPCLLIVLVGRSTVLLLKASKILDVKQRAVTMGRKARLFSVPLFKKVSAIYWRLQNWSYHS